MKKSYINPVINVEIQDINVKTKQFGKIIYNVQRGNRERNRERMVKNRKGN